MRFMLFLLLVAPLATVPLEQSYAQTNQGIVSIYAQIVIRDSNGNLVSYLESGRITILNEDALNALIDKNPDLFHQKPVTAGSQTYDLITATDIVIHSSATIVSQNTISVSNGTSTLPLVLAVHDGYPVSPGYKVTTFWTILRLGS